MNSIYDWFATQNFSNSVALECGAHTFSDTERLSKIFKTVLAVEANPNAKFTSFSSNVLFEPQALSTQTGSISFFLDQNPEGNAGASSLLASSPFYMQYIKRESEILVPCITLQDAMRKHNLDKIDFFWLDMEGYELNFLKGTDLSTVSYIYTEVNFQQFRKQGCLYKEIKEYLESQGLMETLQWKNGQNWNGDVLFQRT